MLPAAGHFDAAAQYNCCIALPAWPHSEHGGQRHRSAAVGADECGGDVIEQGSQRASYQQALPGKMDVDVVVGSLPPLDNRTAHVTRLTAISNHQMRGYAAARASC